MDSHTTVRWSFFGSLALLLACFWLSERLPPPGAIREELLSEPAQVEFQSAVFKTSAGGIEYSVQPRFTYDLYGLVVSRHDSAAWWDYVHKEWNDNLNVVDLCVVWGDNIRRDAYRRVSFTHDQWTCWYETRSQEAWQAFDTTAISNNHLLADHPRLAAALRSARIGDQVHIRGYLADYSTPAGLTRKTSTVRTDSGNGACEVVYVEEFEILKSGGSLWRKLKWVAIALLCISAIAWYRLPLRAR